MRSIRQRIVTAGSLGGAVLFALTACAGSAAPVGAANHVSAVSSATPTERTGKGNTEDTSSTVPKAAIPNQEVLIRFDTWVRAQPGVYTHGFIASVDDIKTKSVTLLWFGTDPWRNRLVVAGREDGVTVGFQQRSESLASFTATQKRLSDASARFRALGFTLSTISGIEAKPEPLTMEGTFANGADRAALQALAIRIAGQPVLVKAGRAGY